MEAKETQELDFDRYEEVLHKHPYEVFYKSDTAEEYGASGIRFSISPPGYQCLLHKDIWVKYTLYVKDTNAQYVQNIFENAAISVVPQTLDRIALRSGNVMARCSENVVLQINGKTFNYQPSLYVDVMNRLYVSNLKSTEEFASSGGRFDDGNHGVRTVHITYENLNPDDNAVPNGWEFVNDDGNNNTHLDIFHHQGFNIDRTASVDPASDLVCNLRPQYIVRYPWYNPGFSERFDKFSIGLREKYHTDADYYPDAGSGANPPGIQFLGSPNLGSAGGAISVWRIELYERLPLPLFKMYTNDNVEGVIPFVASMKYTATFNKGNLKANIFRSVTEGAWNLDWTGIGRDQAVIYTKWFVLKTPLPKRVTINFPLYITQYETFTINNTIVASDFVNDIPGTQWWDGTVKVNQINFPKIPDLLLIYCKVDSDSMQYNYPDDFNLSFLSFYMTFNSSNSKFLGIQPIQMYQIWKRNLKYHQEKIIDFNEWFQYCCVLCFKPEDFGVKIEQEYNKPCQFSINATVRNRHVNPSIYITDPEYFNPSKFKIVFHGIYLRNKAYMTYGTFEDYLPSQQTDKKI